MLPFSSPPCAACIRYDSRSQVDLEVPTEAEAALLAGRAGLATLCSGDALFLPHAWWHHVHATCGDSSSASDGLSVSLNFWFNPFQVICLRQARVGVHGQPWARLLRRPARNLILAPLA